MGRPTTASLRTRAALETRHDGAIPAGHETDTLARALFACHGAMTLHLEAAGALIARTRQRGPAPARALDNLGFHVEAIRQIANGLWSIATNVTNR